MPIVESRELDRDVAGCAQAHQLLLATLDAITDEQARQPSLLPGWSIGHVVTHLARNADSHVLMLAAADRGDVADQYPGGNAQRREEIELGSGRSAAELTADARTSIWRLEGVWANLSQGWLGKGRSLVGVVDAADLPFRRWREVTLHHSDLGLDYSWTDWPSDYVRIELARMTAAWSSRRPMGLTALPAAALGVEPVRRLAWLTGRTEIDGLPPAGIFA